MCERERARKQNKKKKVNQVLAQALTCERTQQQQQSCDRMCSLTIECVLLQVLTCERTQQQQQQQQQQP